MVAQENKPNISERKDSRSHQADGLNWRSLWKIFLNKKDMKQEKPVLGAF